jgi:hypothetical protein
VLKTILSNQGVIRMKSKKLVPFLLEVKNLNKKTGNSNTHLYPITKNCGGEWPVGVYEQVREALQPPISGVIIEFPAVTTTYKRLEYDPKVTKPTLVEEE